MSVDVFEGYKFSNLRVVSVLIFVSLVLEVLSAVVVCVVSVFFVIFFLLSVLFLA